MSLIAEFIARIQAIYATGIATEHSYRSAFEALFAALDPEIAALNEPKRVKCGAPDFIVTKGDIVIGHVEAKDLHIGLRGMKDANKNQQDRYRAALSSLIYTNALDWDFYRDGDLVASVTIADFVMGIQPKPGRTPRSRHARRGAGVRLHLWRAALPRLPRDLCRIPQD